MRRLLIITASFLFTFFIGFFSPSPVFAANYTLSGNISSSQAGAIEGADIGIFDLSNAPIGSTVSDIAGNYSFTITEGVYNIQVTPPSGSGFSSAIALQQTISQDTVLNFILVNAGTVTLSGHVYDSFGNGVPDQEISLSIVSGPIFIAMTDISGYYSLEVSPNSYVLRLQSKNGGNSLSLNLPQYYEIQVSSSFSLTQSTILDWNIPAKRVDIHAQDVSGNAISGAQINVNTNGQANIGGITIGGITTENADATYLQGPFTNASGDAVVWVVPNTPNGAKYNFTAIPPSGADLGTTIVSGITVVSDLNQVITLEPKVTLSGYVYDPLGNGVANQEVSLSIPNGASFVAQTDASGYYALQVSPNTYTLRLQSKSGGNPLSVNLPQFYDIQVTSSYTLSQSTTLDWYVPAKRVDVHVQDTNGTAISGARVNVATLNGQANIGGFSIGGITISFSDSNYLGGPFTDALGNAVVWVIQNSTSGDGYDFTVIPPSGSNFEVTTILDVNVVEDLSQVVILEPKVTLSGYVYDSLGNGVPNQQVSLSIFNGPIFSASTDATGFYSLQVSPNTYILRLQSNSGGNDLSLNLPQYYEIEVTDTFTLTQNIVLDWNVPAKRVDIHVQDANGLAIGGVRINVATNGQANFGGFSVGGITISSSDATYLNGPLTNASGDAAVWVIPNTPNGAKYNFIAIPPSESGHATFVLSNVFITTDITEIISLQSSQPPVVTTLYPIADSYLKQGSQNQNEGASTFLRLQQSGHNRAVVKFDQSQIQDAIGSSSNYTAVLQFTISENGNNWGTSGRTVGAYRLLQDWVEGNGFIVGNAPPDRGTGNGVTWNCSTDSNITNQNDDCSGTTSWNMDNPALWPFASSAIATTTITNNQTGAVTFDVTSDIQSFINGTDPNYGWLIKKDNEGQAGRVHFGSKESSESPLLIVTSY